MCGMTLPTLFFTPELSMGLREQSIVGCFLEFVFQFFRGAGACGVASAIYKHIFPYFGLSCWVTLDGLPRIKFFCLFDKKPCEMLLSFLNASCTVLLLNHLHACKCRMGATKICILIIIRRGSQCKVRRERFRESPAVSNCFVYIKILITESTKH